MATVKEMMLEMMDAANSTATAAMMSAGDTFEGNLDTSNDEDWIKIELSEGQKYTITVMGRATVADSTATADVNEATASMLNDSVLKLLDSKGGEIDENDDKDGAKGMLYSELTFIPEAGSGTQTYYLSVSGSQNNPGSLQDGGYTLSVTAVEALSAGEGADIEGTNMADKLTGTADGESIAGLGGSDTIDGGAGDDSLSGGAGNDLLTGGPGADMLKGGAGNMDTISYKYSPMGVTINLLSGTASGGDAEGDTLGDDIENVIGSKHDDMLTGTDDVNNGNSLWGEGGADRLYGREGPDKLYGGAGDDMLDGGEEDDTLEGGYGADVLTGGRGADTASYASSMMGVTVRLHASQAMGGDAEGDTWGDTATETYTIPAEDPEDPDVEMTETVPDIVNLIGSAHGDNLAGDSRDNMISGGGGGDKIYGGPGGGDDTLMGDGGDDMLFGGRGDDTLNGGMGNDMLNGGAGADNFMGGAGNDMIYADLDDIGETIDGGSNPAGQPGDMDTVSFERLVDMAVGTSTDVFTLGTDALNIERVIGSDEDDFITGSDTAPEEIEGGDGGDTLIGGTGAGDTVSYESSDRRVRVDLGDGTAASPSGGHATGDSIAGFENVKGSAFGDVLEAVDGSANATGSTLWGLGGDDTLIGNAGNDTLEGGAGGDELDGGKTGAIGVENAQDNTLSYAGSDAGVTVNLATASASGGHATGDDIETYEFHDADGDGTPGEANDGEEIDVATFTNVTGSAHNDRLTGDGFDNHLAGGAGDDDLRGGAGGDVLAGGPGADSLDGGRDQGDTQAEDWAAYRGASAGVTVNLNTGSGTGGDAIGDTLKNIELVWGSKHGDMFIASEGVDIIHGDGGSDTVSYEDSKHGVSVTLPGSDDTDQFTAGDSTATPPTVDTYNAAADTVVAGWREGTATRPDAQTGDLADTTDKSYAKGDILASIENVTGSKNDDVINGDGVPNTLRGGAGDDELAGFAGNDKLYGEDGDDTLEGGDGGDMLMGGAGNDDLQGQIGDDTLNGGAGNDDLLGGAGEDTFVFTPGNGDDVISTFVAADDKIDLSAFNISAGELKGLIKVRAGNTVINLEDYGGGTITIQSIDDLDTFDVEADDADNDIDTLSVQMGDLNNDGDLEDTVNGVAEDGIFIL